MFAELFHFTVSQTFLTFSYLLKQEERLSRITSPMVTKESSDVPMVDQYDGMGRK